MGSWALWVAVSGRRDALGPSPGLGLPAEDFSKNPKAQAFKGVLLLMDKILHYPL